MEKGYREPDAKTILTADKETKLKERRENDSKTLAFIKQAVHDSCFKDCNNNYVQKCLGNVVE